ncbi:hypothetical protein HDV00_009301 [Rhizophlyctis rosea]|nr:hypothetical protein HDV00_009301 [Rhizophlyctis rosea]
MLTAQDSSVGGATPSASSIFDLGHQFAAVLNSCRPTDTGVPKTLRPIPFETSNVWYLPPGINHPLRKVQGAEPFFLVTAQKGNGHDQEVEIQLDTFPRVIAGTTMGMKKVNETDKPDTPSLPWESTSLVHPSIWSPVSLEDAKLFLSLYSLHHSSSNPITTPSPLPAVFVFCTSSDESGKTVKAYVGSRGLQTADGFICENIVLDDQGLVAKNSHEEETSCGELPKFENVVEEYLEDCETDEVDGLVCSAIATYDILSDNLFKTTSGPTSCISMEVSWRGTQEILSSPPQSAQITVRIRAVFGGRDPENHIPTSILRAELATLMEWDAIRLGGKEWSDRADTGAGVGTTLSGTVDAFLQPPLSEIKEDGAMMDDRQKDATSAGAPNGNGNTSTSFDFEAASVLPVRSDLDFTEKLWSFLQGAVNQDDITDALTAVVEELETSRLQPVISKTNHTSLATAIRDCFKLARLKTAVDVDEQRQAIARVFDYWLESPLEWVVEIGLGKLRKDCATILGGERVDFFMDATLPLEQQLRRLRYLFRVVELVTLIRSNVLMMPPDVMRLIVRAAVDYWKDVAERWEERGEEMEEDGGGRKDEVEDPVVFHAELPRWFGGGGKAVEGLVSGITPSSWMMTLGPDAEAQEHTDSLPVKHILWLTRHEGVFGENAAMHFNDDAAMDIDGTDQMMMMSGEMWTGPGESQWKMVKGVMRYL